MSYGWEDVCDFNPWDEPATYVSIVLTLMLIYAVSAWLERSWSLTRRSGPAGRRELEQGLTALASIASTGTAMGGLGSVLSVLDRLRLLAHIRSPAWLASELASALVLAAYGLLVSVVAHAAFSHLRRRVDRILATEL